jgi:hypothetical protein
MESSTACGRQSRRKSLILQNGASRLAHIDGHEARDKAELVEVSTDLPVGENGGTRQRPAN